MAARERDAKLDTTRPRFTDIIKCNLQHFKDWIICLKIGMLDIKTAHADLGYNTKYFQIQKMIW